MECEQGRYRRGSDSSKLGLINEACCLTISYLFRQMQDAANLKEQMVRLRRGAIACSSCQVAQSSSIAGPPIRRRQSRSNSGSIHTKACCMLAL